MKYVETYNSAVVFDGVHALYDDKITYSDLISTVLTLDPKKNHNNERHHVKTNHKKNLYPGDVEVINAYNEFNPVRHSFKTIDDFLPGLAAQKRGGKIIINGIEMKPTVLAVFNTVSHAIQFYKNADVKNKILLHSKFKLSDRQRKEREVLNNYSSYDLIVTTQVVEASVDISANTLVTEIAPVPAIVQRAGRVNRRRPYTHPKSPNVYVFTAPDPEMRKPYLPYRKKDIKNSIEILSNIPPAPVNVRKEAEITKEFYDTIPAPPRLTHSTVFTEQYELKNMSTAYYSRFDTVPVLLEEDYEKILLEENRARRLVMLYNSIISAHYYEVKGLEPDRKLPVYIVHWDYDEKLGIMSKEKETETIL